jgi:hypothetical protein
MVQYLMFTRRANRMVTCVLLLLSFHARSQTYTGCLIRFEDPLTNTTGYLSEKGDTVIAFGKYEYCFTNKFCAFAIVVDRKRGIVGINRNEEILFNVFVFDNGPDPLSDGLFRIVKNGKTGYANSKGKIIIPPEYDCAEPFYNGVARVGMGCKTQTNGEHAMWAGGRWFTINRQGKIVKKAKKKHT